MKFSEAFNNTSKVLENIFHEVLEENTTTRSLLRIIDNIEEQQEGLWKWIDYGIRTPVFRNMQWIWYGPEFRTREEEKASRQKEKANGQIKTPLLEVNTHLLKEYFQAWFTLLDLFKTRERKLESAMRQLAEKTGVMYDEGALGELRGGVSAELKACYVLVDHRRPFLPFSIMQAPVVPSVIRLTASGDLYLFEENLVVDVKSGWLMDTKNIGRLPTYFYGKKNSYDKKRGLSTDLRKCSNLQRLYGIRKGIGVVAEDEKEEIIHFAVYVPWRDWQSMGPLLYLKSTKLPFLVYIHREKFELYKGELQNNTLSVELSALLLSRESSWIDSSKWRIEVTSSEGEKIKIPREQAKIAFEKKDENLYSIRVRTPITTKEVIEYSGKKYLALSLIYESNSLKLPVLIEINER